MGSLHCKLRMKVRWLDGQRDEIIDRERERDEVMKIKRQWKRKGTGISKEEETSESTLNMSALSKMAEACIISFTKLPG